MNVAVLTRNHLGQLFALHRNAQPLADTFKEVYAANFVGDVARQHVGGCGAFAQVVHQAGKAHCQWRLQLGGHVHNQHYMDAGVDLGVVFHTLGHAPQPVQLGQQALKRTTVAQHGEHARGLGFHQTAGQLLPHTFGDQMVGLAAIHHFSHQGLGFGGHCEVGEARCKAGQPQDTHRVFAKGRCYMAQHFGCNVALPAVRINQKTIFYPRWVF